MGRYVAKKIRGMNIWSKVALTVLCTFALLVFMYEGWYKPRGVQAVAAYQATGALQSGTAALTVPWPTHQADDVALLFVETANQAVTLSTPAGFTQITNSPQSTGTAAAAGGTRLTVFWARATSSSMQSPVIADSGDHQVAVILTFRGVKTTGDPFEATAGSVKAAASTTTTFPAVTTVSSNALIVNAAAVDLDAANTNVWTAFTNAALTGLAERVDQTVTSGVGGGLGIATGIKATAGSTGTTSGTLTSSITTQMTIALTSDTIAPTVTINQAGGQAETTSTSPINFTVVFSEPTTNFATGDVTISGTAGGTKTATVTGSGTNYNVAVSGMTTSGTVVAAIAAGVATDASGNGNVASTSTDNTVSWVEPDTTPPTVTATDPANGVTAVAPNSSIQVIWNENIDCATVSATDLTINGATVGTPTCNAPTNSVIFPLSGQTNGTLYNVSVIGVSDVNGNAMSSTYIFSYTTDVSAAPPGTISLSSSSYSVYENAGTVTITATRSGGSNGNVGVTYGTSNGSALAGSDYATSSGVLSWGDGDVAPKTFTVNITNDAVEDPNEYFTVTLSNPSGGALLGSTASGTVIITDDEQTSGGDLLHNSTDTGSTKWPGGWGIAGGKYGEFTCATCHEPFADNLKGIRRIIGSMNSDNLPNGQQTAPVYFTNMTGQGKDYAGRITSNRICEVCHSRTRFHNFDATNNSGGNSHPTPVAICTSCHTHNTGFKAACGGCHGNPPTSTTLGGDYGLVGTPRASNALAAGSAGAHATHKNHEMVCDTCHYINNGGIKMPNLSNTIDIGFFGFGGKVTSGTYQPYSSSTPHPGYKFRSGTPNTTIATVVTSYETANRCSNVYCHGGGSVANGKLPLTGGTNQSPKWDDIGQAGCGSCHGATNASTGTLGSHVKHASSATGYNQSCDLCHPAIDMSHVQGSVRWLISPALNRGASATYRDVASGTIGYSGELAPSAIYGTCTNISCHNDGKGGNPRVDAQWGSTTFNAKCDGCHRGNASADFSMNSGMHAQHINQLVVNGVNFGCVECHAKTVIGDRNIGNRANHTSGLVNYSGAQAGKNPASCNTAYCHTNGKGVAGMAVNWTTGPAISNCTGCHGAAGAPAFTAVYGEPNYASGAEGSALANSHQLHSAAGATTCNYCHPDTVNVSGNLSGASHLDRNVQVRAGDTSARNFSYLAGVGNKSCSVVMCHGTGAPPLKWGGVANCTSCHDGIGLTTGYHPAHNNQLAVNGENYGCVECHAQVVNTNTTFSNRTLHANLQANYSGARAGKVKTACAAAYCHSDGKGGQGLAVNWAAPGTTLSNCKGCHGVATSAGFTSLYGEPNYVSSGQQTTRANSHGKHVGTSGAATCVYCHSETVTSTGALIAGKHIDRSINVLNNGTKSFVYNGAANQKTCTNISCHGTAAQATIFYWGNTNMPLDCTGCHGGNAVTGTSAINTGKHAAHINQASLNGTNYGCVECHAQTVDADRNVISQDFHGNQFSNYSGAKAGRNPATCNTAYCHSDGKGSNGLAVNWTSGPAIGCNGCHGTSTADGAPDYASVAEGDFKANSHGPHVLPNRGNFACAVCHYETVDTTGTMILNTGRHLDKSYNVKIAPAYEKAGGASYIGRQCSNVVCHGTSQPKWGGSAAGGCTGCHPTLSLAHDKHVGNLFRDGLVALYNYTSNTSDAGSAVYRFGCATCHPTDINKHRNSIVDIDLRANKPNAGQLVKLNNLNNDTNPGYSRGSGSLVCLTVYCHSNGKDQQGNLTLADYRSTPNWYGEHLSTTDYCASCHGNPPTYAGQSHYVKNSQMGANGTGTPTETGHMVGIHFQNTYVGKNQNGYLGFSSSGNKAHGNPAVATTIGCYICHSGVVSSSQLDTYTLQGEAGSGFRCASCHSSTTRTKLQSGLIVGAKWHVNGQKDVMFPNITFKTKAQLTNVANVLDWSRPNGYKDGDNSFDTCNLGTSQWNAATKTCTTACHISLPDIVWGQPLRCNSCHVSQ